MSYKYNFSLNDAEINSLQPKLRKILKKEKIDDREILKNLLVIESLCLDYREVLGTDASATLSVVSRLGTLNIKLEIAGAPYEIAKGTELEQLSSHLLSQFGTEPCYLYKNGYNTYVISLNRKKKLNPLLEMLLFIAAGGLLGLAVLQCGTSVQDFTVTLLNLLVNTLLGFLSMAAIPMMFFSVITAICNCDSMNNFKRLGKYGMILPVLYTFIGTAIALPVLYICFPLTWQTTGSNIGTLIPALEMVFDIFPNNILKAFTDGNTLQVILIALLVGISLLKLGDKTERITTWSRQMSILTMDIMKLFCRILPYMMALMIAQNVISGDIKQALNVWQLVLTVLLIYAATLLIFACITGGITRLSPLQLLRKISPVLLKATITDSSVATYGDIIDVCTRKFNIRESLVGFCVASGVISMSLPVSLTVEACVIYYAGTSGMEINAAWLLLTFILSFVMSFATPRVSGGLIIMFSMVFSTLGIPNSFLAIVTPVIMLLDYFATGLMCGLITMHTAIAGKKLEGKELAPQSSSGKASSKA